MSICARNLAPQTNEQQLHEFFSYCGTIKRVQLGPLDAATGTNTAVVIFEHGDSVDIAELLGGAMIDGHQIEVSRGSEQSPSHEPEQRFSAVTAVDGLTASGLLQGGREVLGRIHDKAVELDTKYGVRQRVVAGAKTVGRAVGGAVNYVTGRNDVGEIQVACWYWRPNQPQWGEDPRAIQSLKQAAAGMAL